MKLRYWVVFCFILLLASFLRLYHLSSVPPSLDWDEVAIGWNAYSIWKVRLDEYGTHLPWTFRSFGDYKAPALIYITAPFVGLFGLSPWMVRLPSALAGIVTVGLVYFLALEMGRWLWPDPTPEKKSTFFSDKRQVFAFLSMFLMAVSPWHLLYSRPAFEPNLALFFVTTGIYFSLLSLRHGWLWLLPGAAFWVALFTYHSPKLFLPVFLVGFILIFFKPVIRGLWEYWFVTLLTIGIIVWALIPLIRINFVEQGNTRFSSTSIFYEKDKPKPLGISLIREAATNYFSHFAASFYLQGSKLGDRLSLRTYGLMPVVQWLFMVLGIGFLGIHCKQKGSQILLLWLLVGFIPAMIGREVPHSLRSLNVLPAVGIITAYGLVVSWQYLKHQSFFTKLTKNVRGKVAGALIVWLVVVFGLDWSQYLREYYQDYPIYSAPDWQYGYREAATLAQQWEDRVDKVIITGHYGQPYIFTYFYQQRDPQGVLWGSMSKYLFRDINWASDQFEKNTLLIGTPKEIPLVLSADQGQLVDTIKFPDGKIAFLVVKTR